MFRFIHSGDLHLGKRFGNFSGDLPARLREARHAVVGRLAEHARANGASTILLAGDTFDTGTPLPADRRRALAVMREHADVRWVVLPGNHDSLQETELWKALAAEKPENVILATRPEPVPLAPDAVLLPAPCVNRRPGRDLTDWMDGAPTPDGVVRIGLAHGAVLNFSEEGGRADVIVPDRARRAGLAYLALGDWHGPMEVDQRTRYCGTPEPDRFKHNRPGEAVLVTIDGASAPPEVTPLLTGSFEWRTIGCHLLEGDDPRARLDALLPEARTRRQSLVRIEVTGIARLPARTELAAAVADAEHDFAWLQMDDGALATVTDPADLDAIDRAGALREAADALLSEAGDASLPVPQREVAKAALARLYALATGLDP